MPSMHEYFMIHAPIDETWKKSNEFWDINRVEIDGQAMSRNGLYRECRAKHGFSMHIYAISSGETYKIRAGYDPKKGITFVAFDISYNLFGKGFIWKIPQDIVADWARHVGADAIEGKREINKDFEMIFKEIKDLDANASLSGASPYCGACGERNDAPGKYCRQCGTILQSPSRAS